MRKGLPELERFPDGRAARSALTKAQLPWFVFFCLICLSGLVFIVIAVKDAPRLVTVVLGSPFHFVACGLMLSLFFACVNMLILIPMAQKIVRRELRRYGVMLCIYCGYDLRDLTRETCPECGRKIRIGTED